MHTCGDSTHRFPARTCNAKACLTQMLVYGHKGVGRHLRTAKLQEAPQRKMPEEILCRCWHQVTFTLPQPGQPVNFKERKGFGEYGRRDVQRICPPWINIGAHPDGIWDPEYVESRLMDDRQCRPCLH